jgi:hypothetical protein
MGVPENFGAAFASGIADTAKIEITTSQTRRLDDRDIMSRVPLVVFVD